MATTRARLDELLRFATARHGLPYAYGGSFTQNVRSSTDCSGVVFSAAAVLDGKNPHQRYGSTETARLARMNGTAAPCGLRPASSAAAVPADAPLKVGFQHGGGGMNSHTACSFFIDGREYAFESRGWPGVLCTAPSRDRNPPDHLGRAWNSSLFHDFWYYPGPVDGHTDPDAFPLPEGYYFGPYDGPEESISGRAGEPVEWTDGLRRWQSWAGVPIDGIYGERTRARAVELQIPAGLLPDGKIGPRTWALAKENPVADNLDQLYGRITEFIKGYVGPIGSDVKDIREQLVGGRDLVRRADGSVDLPASYPGHEFLGGRTLPDAAGLLGKEINLPGFRDPKAGR